jgi:chorismate-pyruvate lyase
MDIEHLEKRFGITAVEKGFITSDQVIEALTIQVAEDLSIGTHRPIGKILFENELITLQQVDEVLKSMGISENNV